MICSSMNCPMKRQCGLWFANEQPEERRYDKAENLATFGYGSIDANGSKFEYSCGALGNYKMFVPVNTKIESLF